MEWSSTGDRKALGCGLNHWHGLCRYLDDGRIEIGRCGAVAVGAVRRVCRNVKRWRSASMAMRWTAAAMQEAAKGFRRLKAHKQLPALRCALEAPQNAKSHHVLVRHNINLGSDRFSMFQQRAGHPRAKLVVRLGTGVNCATPPWGVMGCNLCLLDNEC
jgi:hypothetical protein